MHIFGILCLFVCYLLFFVFFLDCFLSPDNANIAVQGYFNSNSFLNNTISSNSYESSLGLITIASDSTSSNISDLNSPILLWNDNYFGRNFDCILFKTNKPSALISLENSNFDGLECPDSSSDTDLNYGLISFGSVYINDHKISDEIGIDALFEFEFNRIAFIGCGFERIEASNAALVKAVDSSVTLKDWTYVRTILAKSGIIFERVDYTTISNVNMQFCSSKFEFLLESGETEPSGTNVSHIETIFEFNNIGRDLISIEDGSIYDSHDVFISGFGQSFDIVSIVIDDVSIKYCSWSVIVWNEESIAGALNLTMENGIVSDCSQV